MCENMVQPDDNIIFLMRIACKTTKGRTHTHTHSEYVIFIVLPRHQWLCERGSGIHIAYRQSCCPSRVVAVINPFVCGLPEVPDSQTVDFRISTVTECLTAEPEFRKIRSDSE